MENILGALPLDKNLSKTPTSTNNNSLKIQLQPIQIENPSQLVRPLQKVPTFDQKQFQNPNENLFHVDSPRRNLDNFGRQLNPVQPQPNFQQPGIRPFDQGPNQTIQPNKSGNLMNPNLNESELNLNPYQDQDDFNPYGNYPLRNVDGNTWDNDQAQRQSNQNRKKSKQGPLKYESVQKAQRGIYPIGDQENYNWDNDQQLNQNPQNEAYEGGWGSGGNQNYDAFAGSPPPKNQNKLDLMQPKHESPIHEFDDESTNNYKENSKNYRPRQQKNQPQEEQDDYYNPYFQS